MVELLNCHQTDIFIELKKSQTRRTGPVQALKLWSACVLIGHISFNPFWLSKTIYDMTMFYLLLHILLSIQIKTNK